MSLPTRYCIALCFGALFSIALAIEVVDNVGITTERPVFLSDFDRIITRMESTNGRIAKVLNETRQNDVKSLHELLIGRGYQHTAEVGYHKLYSKQLSWYDALQRCRMEDAHLAIIDSSAEAVVISKLVKEKLPAVSDEKSVAYVGYHDYCANGWIDVFFKPLGNDNDYVHWKQGAPQSTAGPKCATIDGDEYLRSSRCTAERAFICETKLPNFSKVY
ncbi:hemolymph lipopolysaccharide-binding protein [Nasonia vitripennis]|uniref:C-type lectin domain-containing protein n=1 Tax=Nasonia vitripennis TaxID=7425 RepID=A0A7M7GDG7_NASVI|nr:hemolymph lipopolysaccharide-binding protein [Nasonia vitripennis]